MPTRTVRASMRRRPTRRGKEEREAFYRSAAYRDLEARLAANVRALRAERDWSQELAAEQCGLSPRVVQTVEAGTNATLVTLARLADGFDVDVTRLLRARAAR